MLTVRVVALVKVIEVLDGLDDFFIFLVPCDSLSDEDLVSTSLGVEESSESIIA